MSSISFNTPAVKASYERGRLIALKAKGKIAPARRPNASYERGRAIALRALGKAKGGKSHG